MAPFHMLVLPDNSLDTLIHHARFRLAGLIPSSCIYSKQFRISTCLVRLLLRCMLTSPLLPSSLGRLHVNLPWFFLPWLKGRLASLTPILPALLLAKLPCFHLKGLPGIIFVLSPMTVKLSHFTTEVEGSNKIYS